MRRVGLDGEKYIICAEKKKWVMYQHLLDSEKVMN